MSNASKHGYQQSSLLFYIYVMHTSKLLGLKKEKKDHKKEFLHILTYKICTPWSSITSEVSK